MTRKTLYYWSAAWVTFTGCVIGVVLAFALKGIWTEDHRWGDTAAAIAFVGVLVVVPCGILLVSLFEELSKREKNKTGPSDGG